MSVQTERVPLTFGQKTRLAFDCLPLVTFALLIAAYVTLLRPIVGRATLSFYALMAVVIVMTGYTALKRCRDLALGAAFVGEDVLERFGRLGPPPAEQLRQVRAARPVVDDVRRSAAGTEGTAAPRHIQSP